MKREAQEFGGIEQVRFKQQEIGQRLKVDLARLKGLINPNMSQNQLAAQMNAILVPMTEFINKKVLEIASLKVPQPPPAADDDHLVPRGKKQNPKLPDFWRRNYDYGESHYMHMDELKTITDRPMSKKR